MKIPNDYEIILLLLGLNDGKFKGKTNVHKNLYLIGRMFDLQQDDVRLPYKYKPYFYGPFSPQVSNALDLLGNVDLISTSERCFTRDSDSLEMRMAIYELSTVGSEAYEQLKEEFSEFFEVFSEAFGAIKKTRFHQNTKILSTAAKVYLIIAREGKAMMIPSIKKKASELGWQVSESDINKAAGILKTTGLAKPQKT